MCKEVVETVPEASKLMSNASDVLGYDLLKVCTEGPKDLLDTTTVSQPAIFVASMCSVEKFKFQSSNDINNTGKHILNQANECLGLSLGEYSALCHAKAFSFEDGVRLTKARGEAMQAASDLVPTAMVSLVGLNQAKVEELCEHVQLITGKQIQIGNYLSQDMFVVSGDLEACQYIVKNKGKFKKKQNVGGDYSDLRLVKQLPVAGAFHTDFMKPALKPLQEVLNDIIIKPPSLPVYSNVTGYYHDSTSSDSLLLLKQNLLKQVTCPVQFSCSIEQMIKNSINDVVDNGYDGNDEVIGYEFGPGKAVSSIINRTTKAIQMNNTDV